MGAKNWRTVHICCACKLIRHLNLRHLWIPIARSTAIFGANRRMGWSLRASQNPSNVVTGLLPNNVVVRHPHYGLFRLLQNNVATRLLCNNHTTRLLPIEYSFLQQTISLCMVATLLIDCYPISLFIDYCTTMLFIDCCAATLLTGCYQPVGVCARGLNHIDAFPQIIFKTLMFIYHYSLNCLKPQPHQSRLLPSVHQP